MLGVGRFWDTGAITRPVIGWRPCTRLLPGTSGSNSQLLLGTSTVVALENYQEAGMGRAWDLGLEGAGSVTSRIA